MSQINYQLSMYTRHDARDRLTNNSNNYVEQIRTNQLITQEAGNRSRSIVALCNINQKLQKPAVHNKFLKQESS